MGCTKSKPRNFNKQSKDIDDKRVFKFGAEILSKDFSLQLGYHRRATKKYDGDIALARGTSVNENVDNIVQQNSQENSS